MAKKKVSAAAATEEGQLHIPGMEPVKNARVHPKAVRYAKVRDARIAANAEEAAAHDSLRETMLAEGLEHYEYKGLRVDIDRKSKCKVSTESAKGDGEGREE